MSLPKPDRLIVTAAIALRMLCQRKARLVATIAGMAALFFVGIAQTGMMLGWINTISAIVSHADVDLWVMAEHTPAFDYGSAIPLERLYQVRSVPGVAWADAMLETWSVWQCADGRRINVELIGLDDSGVGGPWAMAAGSVDDLHEDRSVIVDEMFLAQLGVRNIGDEVELFSKRAIVRGLSRDVRTFTSAPFVFSSLRTALEYDSRYRDDEITYVLVRCDKHQRVEQTAKAIELAVPGVEVLASGDFARRSVVYWMLGTGIGVTVILTTVLALFVAALVGGQTLFGITSDHLDDYAALIALGFDRWQMVTVVALQGLFLSAAGALLGSALFAFASRQTRQTPLPLDMNRQVYALVVGASLLAGVAGGLLSVRTVLRIDPVSVFKG